MGYREQIEKLMTEGAYITAVFLAGSYLEECTHDFIAGKIEHSEYKKERSFCEDILDGVFRKMYDIQF